MGDYDNMLHAVRAITAEEGFMAFYQVQKSSCVADLHEIGADHGADHSDDKPPVGCRPMHCITATVCYFQ